MRQSLMALVLAGCTFDGSGVARQLPGLDSDQPIVDQGTTNSIADSADDVPVDHQAGDVINDGQPLISPLGNGVRVVYGQPLPTGGLLKTRTSNGDWVDEVLPPFAGELVWVRYMVTPSAEVVITKEFHNNTVSINGYQLAESGWQQDFATADADPDYLDRRDFAAAVESSSGEWLVVYGDGTKQPIYRTGTSAGAWSDPIPMPINTNKGEDPVELTKGDVLWIEAASRPATDEVMIVYGAHKSDLAAIKWDGDAWDRESARKLDNKLWKHSSDTLRSRSFDLAYEASGDEVIVAWGSSETWGFRYRTFNGSWNDEGTISAPKSGHVEFVDLASAPQKDAIAGVFVDMNNNTERLGLATWGGDDWVWSDEVDSQIREIDQPTGDFPAAVAWAGANGDTAICVYSDSQSATIDWYRWDGSTWKVGVDEAVSTSLTESVVLHRLHDGKVLALISDSGQRLVSAVYDDGQGWQYEQQRNNQLRIDTLPVAVSTP